MRRTSADIVTARAFRKRRTRPSWPPNREFGHAVGLALARGAVKNLSGIDGVPTRKLRFAGDSPLEGAVTSETVSGAKFPASWENTGNFVRLGLRVHLLARNQTRNSMACDAIPYAPEQGIYFVLAGN